MPKNYSLLIQGPLVSEGIAGSHIHKINNNNITDNHVSFNCRNNIQQIINDYGNLFTQVVISTWDDEIKADDKFTGAKLISQPDPGSHSTDWNGKQNNKNRQFIGIKKGIEYLKNQNFNGYVLKIRTDSLPDIAAIMEYFESLPASDKDFKIGVPAMIPHQCYIQDFYFIANIDVLFEFCEVQITYPEFTSSVHNEPILKYGFAKFRDEIDVEPVAYFPAYFKPVTYYETLIISEFMCEKVFFSLPEDIFFNQTWRGSKIHIDFFLKYKHAKKITFRTTNIKLISCNYAAYLEVVKTNDVISYNFSLPNTLSSTVNKYAIYCAESLHRGYRQMKRLIRKASTH